MNPEMARLLMADQIANWHRQQFPQGNQPAFERLLHEYMQTRARGERLIPERQGWKSLPRPLDMIQQKYGDHRPMLPPME